MTQAEGGARRYEPIVCMRLGGGLGNQLFQYSFGRRLALANNARLYLDASGYQHISTPDPELGVRVLGLDHFQVLGTLIRHADEVRPHRSWFVRKFHKYRGRAARLLEMTKPYYLRREVVEPEKNHFWFDARLYNRPIKKDVVLSGYWQSEKYFADIEALIRQELSVKDELTGLNAEMAQAIHATHSVSIHVRHGDNANKVAQELGVLPPRYFSQAVSGILNEVPEPHFFVFSDDIAWARNVIVTELPTTFVAHNGDARNYEDLRLMSFCKHHILGNSTFSWWGAWLGRKPGQIVYAPRRYWQNIDRPNPDLYPPAWRLI